MTALLPLLALVGGAALVSRLLRALLRLGLSSAEATAARGLSEVSARRGDLTGLAERRHAERELRTARRRDTLLALFWLLALVIPPLLGWMPEAFAAASLLWFLPRRRLRSGTRA